MRRSASGKVYEIVPSRKQHVKPSVGGSKQKERRVMLMSVLDAMGADDDLDDGRSRGT